MLGKFSFQTFTEIPKKTGLFDCSGLLDKIQYDLLLYVFHNYSSRKSRTFPSSRKARKTPVIRTYILCSVCTLKIVNNLNKR